MKKIAFVSTNNFVPWGGSEELWSQAASELSRRGHSIGVNVKHWDKTPDQLCKLQKASSVEFRHHLPPMQRIFSKIFPQHNKIFKYPYTWLDRFNPDLVVISHGISFESPAWEEACLKKKIPYATIIHAASENRRPDDKSVLKIARLYAAAKRVFFVSRANVDIVEKQLAVKLGNARVVYNPIKVPFDSKLPWPDDSFIRFACVGRLDCAVKGQDLILEVLRQKKWRARSVSLTFFGEGTDRLALEILKNLRGLKNVKFGGFVEDVQSIWRDHHALISPSRFEGMPMTVLEAMFCARFCIATNIGIVPDVITDNKNGFIIKDPDAKCVDEAMERAWQSRKRWKEISCQAATDIRAKIPSDPVGQFADEVEKFF